MHGGKGSTMIMKTKGDIRDIAHRGKDGQNEAELPLN